MEIIIGLIVFAGAAYYLMHQHRKMSKQETNVDAPYKVEAPVAEEVVVVTPEATPVATPEVAKQKKPRRQQSAKTEAKPVKNKVMSEKKPAAIQSAGKAKKPRTPKAK